MRTSGVIAYLDVRERTWHYSRTVTWLKMNSQLLLSCVIINLNHPMRAVYVTFSEAERLNPHVPAQALWSSLLC